MQTGTPRPAPQPSAPAREHSAALVRRIHDEIERSGGRIPFRRYMELALYTPGLGYYAAAGGRALGEGGDFVTAPEVSPLFAGCIAHQCAEVLATTGGGDVLEPGPGTGELAVGILEALERIECLPDRYLLLEVSAELRERQRERLAARVPHLLARCEWLDAWPQRITGVVVANEVLDALPIEGFRIGDGGVEQRLVRREGEGLADDWAPAPQALCHAVAHIEADVGWPLPAGYVSELSPDLPAWFAALGDVFDRGAALFIDYGYARREYYLPERHMGTLVCTRAHRAHDDPYDWPGLTDITAFVDFTAVAEAAVAADLELEGFTPQAHFLMATGLEALAAEGLAAEDERTRLATSQQVKKLTLPGEMGERFSVIGFSRGLERPLSGFALNDLSRRL